MKTFRKITSWIIVSLVVQFAGLFYINNYFLSSNTEIKTKKIVKSEPKKDDAVVKIPDDATNISTSFDGMYISYYEENTLKIINTKNGNEKNIYFKNGSKMSFYKWLKDRNRMLIAEKQSSDSEDDGYIFNLEYYEVDKDIKENIKKLKDLSSKTEIEDIQESPLTNVIYIKTKDSGERTNIYRINIMNEMEKVKTNSCIVGNMGILSLKDKLIYEDDIYHKIYVTGQDEPLNLSSVKNPVWVGVDDDDRVYIGDMQDNKVSNLYYGNIDDTNKNYQTINIGESVNASDIYVNKSGKVYVNNNLKGEVKDISSGKTYTYHGQFVQMYDNGIISVSDGKLVKTLLN
ncbi:hypothetical protein J2Z42_002844 [Clostridium algifaecis]|uniref:Uncharacterized protein n=1 Tax=Clostridium algifaecis TaxID=1472040 RepID=A0ABS4KVS4_9CLOT|nr:hypothetical protein [Clostridium algifaecis]MBP2034117.1 hypothetical protein [Clostridium algifaecis]